MTAVEHSGTPPPEDGLGYSRHYAQRIRDLGQTSKESWIKRLWNHMFGMSGTNKTSTDAGNLASSNKSSVSATKQDASVHKDSATRPHVSSSASSGKDRQVHFIEHDGMRTSDSDPQLGFGRNSSEASLNGISKGRAQSSQERTARVLPVQLINSPYLPPKEKVVYYRPALSVKLPDDARDGLVAARLRYQRISQEKTGLGSSSTPNIKMSMDTSTSASQHGSNTSRRQPAVINQNAPNNHYHVSEPQPYRPRVTRDVNTIQLEKRAKVNADRAIKVRLESSNSD